MQLVAAPRVEPFGPWVEVILATPGGTFQWPPERYGWGAALVKCKSPSAKDNQKAAGRGKRKTKKSGPEPIPVTIEFTWRRDRWDGAQGMGALLAALDPNNPAGGGGPFDFQAADFNRRGGKSIDVDEVGEVVYTGDIGRCTVTAKEWVPEPPKDEAQGTKTPDKATEHVPGDEDLGLGDEESGNGVPIARKGVAALFRTAGDAAVFNARPVAERGFDGPEKPTAAP